MAYNAHYLLLLTILAVVCLISDLPSAVLGSGEWQEVDPNDPEVLANAKFAIDEHNKVPKPKLLFERVFKAEKQVVEEGINYRIDIQAVKDTNLDANQLDYAQTAHASGKDLIALINEVLDQAKIESGRLELEAVPFDLRADLDKVPEVVIGDPGRFRQIITNLVGNSIKVG
ncbi:hypothetical protein ACH5RR_017477 [Cinchona calisaya]|uniref:histidine kinase n=1 Tax=Cinchona calisaya TaxID=153742 RepID=A0ABD2ZJ02_9GENT